MAGWVAMAVPLPSICSGGVFGSTNTLGGAGILAQSIGGSGGSGGNASLVGNRASADDHWRRCRWWRRGRHGECHEPGADHLVRRSCRGGSGAIHRAGVAAKAAMPVTFNASVGVPAVSVAVGGRGWRWGRGRERYRQQPGTDHDLWRGTPMRIDPEHRRRWGQRRRGGGAFGYAVTRSKRSGYLHFRRDGRQGWRRPTRAALSHSITRADHDGRGFFDRGHGAVHWRWRRHGRRTAPLPPMRRVRKRVFRFRSPWRSAAPGAQWHRRRGGTSRMKERSRRSARMPMAFSPKHRRWRRHRRRR